MTDNTKNINIEIKKNIIKIDTEITNAPRDLPEINLRENQNLT